MKDATTTSRNYQTVSLIKAFAKATPLCCLKIAMNSNLNRSQIAVVISRPIFLKNVFLDLSVYLCIAVIMAVGVNKDIITSRPYEAPSESAIQQ